MSGIKICRWLYNTWGLPVILGFCELMKMIDNAFVQLETEEEVSFSLAKIRLVMVTSLMI